MCMPLAQGSCAQKNVFYNSCFHQVRRLLVDSCVYQRADFLEHVFFSHRCGWWTSRNSGATFYRTSSINGPSNTSSSQQKPKSFGALFYMFSWFSWCVQYIPYQVWIVKYTRNFTNIRRFLEEFRIKFKWSMLFAFSRTNIHRTWTART